MKDLSIGIIGGGVVGHATARAFIEHVKEVRVWDLIPERRTVSDPKLVLDCDLIFVCLPTPQREGSLECNTDYIVGFFKSLHDHYRDSNFVLRSTVPIGFTRITQVKMRLPNLVHSPEFLTARTSITDAMIPSRNVIGGYIGPCYQSLRNLYAKRFPGVPVHLMSSDESEAVKLFCNGFFATKISYFNEVRALSDSLGLDWDRILAGVLSDGRISHSHTQVPGPDGKRGFGGTCLPKDLANLIHCLGDEGIVTHAALIRNGGDRS